MTGCAVHPLPEDVTRRSTYDIVQSIRCEAKQAIMQHAPDASFDRAIVGYEFLFKITEHNDNSGGATFKYPFTNGVFTLAM